MNRVMSKTKSITQEIEGETSYKSTTLTLLMITIEIKIVEII